MFQNTAALYLWELQLEESLRNHGEHKIEISTYIITTGLGAAMVDYLKLITVTMRMDMILCTVQRCKIGCKPLRI